MAIGKRSESKLTASEREFIHGAAEAVIAQNARDSGKKPIMIRIDPKLLERVDKAANRLGISRSAFIVSSTARAVEGME